MTENRCVYCCGEIPKGCYICPDCKELMKDEPIVLDVITWRPFPLIKPKITSKEYLVTSEDTDRSIHIALWDGYDWISTEDYFSITDRIVAWAELPSTYNL